MLCFTLLTGCTGIKILDTVDTMSKADVLEILAKQSVKTKELVSKSENLLAESAKKLIASDLLLEGVSKKEEIFTAALDADGDGELTKEEAMGALTNPSVISQLTTDIARGYTTGDWAGAAGTLFTFFLLFQGNHIFEVRSKFKKYVGGGLGRGWNLLKTFNPIGKGSK